MVLTAYEKPADWLPDPQYVNDPFQDLEYYAWLVGSNLKNNLWIFYPAVAVPTQDLEVDILGDEFAKYELNDDLTKYGFKRNFLTKESISNVEVFFTDSFAVIDSLV